MCVCNGASPIKNICIEMAIVSIWRKVVLTKYISPDQLWVEHVTFILRIATGKFTRKTILLDTLVHLGLCCNLIYYCGNDLLCLMWLNLNVCSASVCRQLRYNVDYEYFFLSIYSSKEILHYI